MNKVLCIVGPTATGKTQLALDLARKWNGVLINCDSIQVYQGLDIVSSKDIPLNAPFFTIDSRLLHIDSKYHIGYYLFNNIPVYLLDVVPPTYNFNVHDYLEVTISIIYAIHTQENLPILVGGTGFYLKALLDGIETLAIAPNPTLRRELEQRTVEELFKTLKKENSERFLHMNESDRNNKRRLIRAIEVARFFQKQTLSKQVTKKLEADIFIVGLCAPREVLVQRINARVKEWLRKGALSEAQKLFKDYRHLSPQVKTAVGYRQLFEHLLGKTTFHEAINNLQKAEYQYAKKQMTFFRKLKEIHWLDITDVTYTSNIENKIKNWYNKKL